MGNSIFTNLILVQGHLFMSDDVCVTYDLECNFGLFGNKMANLLDIRKTQLSDKSSSDNCVFYFKEDT